MMQFTPTQIIGITPTLEQFVTVYNTLFTQEWKQVSFMLAPMYPNWPIEKIKEALEKFEKYDEDGSGTIDIDEFINSKKN